MQGNRVVYAYSGRMVCFGRVVCGVVGWYAG